MWRVLYSVQIHYFASCVFFVLIQRLETNILRRFSVVSEWADYRVHVVSTDGHERTLSADILVQFVLKIDETIVRIFGQCDAP